MKKWVLLMAALFIFASPVSAEPASISFDPIDIKASTQEIIKVDINIYTDAQPVASTDVWITYDPAYLEPLVDETQAGSLFETIDTKIVSPGKVYIYGLQKNTFNVGAVQGKLATVVFKTKAAGETQLSFDCVPSKKRTSQIIKADRSLTNIISCSATMTHTAQVTISQKSSILGAATGNFSVMKILYGTIGIIVAILTVYLFIKYERKLKQL
jgi:hypothetical protein